MLRKTPQQDRSRFVVQTILDGASRVFGSRPLHDVNTSTIAEVSGVSVGSLYQYFDNKLEIAACLAEEHATRSVEFATALLQSEHSRPILGACRLLLRELLAQHERERTLHLNFLALEPVRKLQRPEAALDRHIGVLSERVHEEFPHVDAESSALYAKMLMWNVHVMVHSAITWPSDDRDRRVTEHFDALLPAYEQAMQAARLRP